MTDLKQTASMILTDIDCHVVRSSDQSHRTHLGASEIGDECERKLWYKFRWVYNKRFNGRMLRLFQRGNDEEPRIIAWLEQAGWKVRSLDPATGEQFRFSACGGHFGGSLDGLATPPEKYAWMGDVVTEFKTSNAQRHAKLIENGVKAENPRHYAQMMLYGVKFGCKYALYLSVNKNDDTLYCEIVEIAPAFAADMEQKAQQIIFATEPPPKIHDDPTWWQCKMCDFAGTCHHSKAAEKNCRSCANAQPIDDGEWYCNEHGIVIPKDKIGQEWPCWKGIV